jgi:hypothetical protein
MSFKKDKIPRPDGWKGFYFPKCNVPGFNPEKGKYKLIFLDVIS